MREEVVEVEELPGPHARGGGALKRCKDNRLGMGLMSRRDAKRAKPIQVLTVRDANLSLVRVGMVFPSPIHHPRAYTARVYTI